ncbi:hypothetical protein [Apilactobacillus ozensis]|uniref:hypothetical protein n=1 Tax=Apilactobacillus ozensis TaxID=866801 RepID=UPI0006D1B4C9|nr:hypothetical protein [Apilactobacillus ozensis]
MNDKNKEPWNETFEDYRDKDGNLSRSKMRKQNHSNKVTTIILVTIIAMIALFALAFGMLKSQMVVKVSLQKNASSISVSSYSHHKSSQSNKHKAASNSKKSEASSSSKKKLQVVRVLHLVVLKKVLM